MKILGIEGTAWNLGISIYDTVQDKILLDLNYPYIPLKGGLNPKFCYRSHYNNILKIIKDLKSYDFEVVAYSKGPGFFKPLRLICFFTRCIHILLNKKIKKGIHHGIGHYKICEYFKKIKIGEGLLLYVSGGHTQIIYKKNKKYRVIGESLDIAIGTLLDKTSRLYNLEHPGGPKIEKIARTSKKYLKMPYNLKNSFFNFSGIYSFIKNKYLKTEPINDVFYSLQETIFSMVVECCERTMINYNLKTVTVFGGVANNKVLIDKIEKMCSYRKFIPYYISGRYNGDNGLMIAIGSINNPTEKTLKNVIPNVKMRLDD